MSEFWPSYSETAIKEFLGNSSTSPVAMRSVNVTPARAARLKIVKFMNAIKQLPDGAMPCTSAYLAFEQDRLWALDMVIESANRPLTNSLNDHLFGKLSDIAQPEALAHLYHYLVGLVPNSTAVQQKRAFLLDNWSPHRADDSIVAKFSSINNYRLQLRPFVETRFDFLENLLSGHAEHKTLPSETVRSILRQSITHILGDNHGGWTAIIQEGAPNVFIDYERRAIVIPAGRSYAQDHINTLIVHEIGVHVLRSVNGERSLERLAAYGLAGYGPAEEAFGVLLGNATRNKYQPINSLVPFAVVDFAERATPSTFRQVHELTLALIICLANPDQAAYEKDQLQYARTAFSRVNRVLRLGNTELVERSTTKYWRGQLLLCRFFDTAGLSQQSFDDFFLGKYDCLSPKQLRLIQTHTE